MKKALIISFMLAGLTPCIAQSVDLQLSSVVANPTSFPTGSNGTIELNLRQNGPGDLPVEAAYVTISINTSVITYQLPATISDNCGTKWGILDASTAGDGQIVLTNTAPLTNTSNCTVSVPVTGASQNLAVVTVASTILAPGVSDRNGSNQGITQSFDVTSPLPVTLSEFVVIKEGSTAQLNWKTTEESNSDYFEIQHSVDTRNWNGLGQIRSNGESSVERNYNYNHISPAAGTNYYRLKMVDRDRTFSYSRIRDVDMEGTSISLTLAPNPVSDLLKIKTADWSVVRHLEIVDLNGRSVYSGSSALAENGISVRDLHAGIYLLRIAKANGETSVHKFIVNR